MPIISVCRMPGCANGKGCRLHKRKSAALRGYGKQWKDVRAAFLARKPRCQDCGEPALDVHHVLRLAAPGGSHRGQLLPLCHSCHSKRTQKGQ